MQNEGLLQSRPSHRISYKSGCPQGLTWTLDMDETYFLRVQVLAFRLMGFDLWHNDSPNDRPQISIFVIGTMGAFLGPLFFAIRFYITNVSIMSDAMGSFLAIILTLVKYGVFVYYRRDFVQLIYRIRGILERGK